MDDVNYGHWEVATDFDPADWFGFIYRIVDLENGREYIGKKQFTKTRRKVVKGKTRRKVVKSDSDWRTYSSSSTHVNAAIEEKGKNNFVFMIESLHKTKAGLFYAEIEYQVLEDVLRAKLPSGERKYYNAMVANVKFLPPVETDDEASHRVTTVTKKFSVNKNLAASKKKLLVERHRINGRNSD